MHSRFSFLKKPELSLMPTQFPVQQAKAFLSERVKRKERVTDCLPTLAPRLLMYVKLQIHSSNTPVQIFFKLLPPMLLT